MDHSGSAAFGFEGEKGHGIGAIGGQFFDKLELEVVGDAGGGAEGAEEEREVEGKGDAVVGLAGDPVLRKEGFLFEFGDGLDAIVGEKVVEEECVVSCEIDMADFAHLL